VLDGFASQFRIGAHACFGSGSSPRAGSSATLILTQTMRLTMD
jgi:hypothetical protein